MRSPIPFDTHAYVKDLVAAGVPEAQAEVHARVLADSVFTTLATKEDIAALKVDLAALEGRLDVRFKDLEQRVDLRFKEQEARFDARLKDLELRLTLRVGGMLAASVAAMAALVKLL
jgi:hypothetical protein